MAWLLDTMILSEGRRTRPEPKVTVFYNAQPLDQLYISVLTFADIRFGSERLDDPARRTGLQDWLTLKLRPMFVGRVLPITEDILLKWRLLLEKGRKTGYTFSHPDIIIAATALQHGLTVVARDRSDYDRAGVPVLNPWENP